MTYSQFFDKAPLLFFAGLGLFQTYVTGLLNIASTACIPFPVHYIEPYIFLVLLFLDRYRMVQPSLIAAGYTLIVVFILIEYLLFLYGMVTTLTKYLGIRFLRVKDKTDRKN